MLQKIVDSAYLNKLDRITQWEDKLVINHESVAQHSYKVALFARTLLEDIFGNSEVPEVMKFKVDVVTYALLHDWDEIFISRDISHETKYNEHNGEEIRNALNEYVQYTVKKEFSGDENTASYMMMCNIVSPDKEVKIFVKFCDWRAMCNFIKREISMGNNSMMGYYEYCLKSLEKAAENVKDMLLLRFNQKVEIKY